MANLRFVIPGAILFCYFIYLSVSLFRSNWKQRQTLQEQHRVRERVAQRLEQERREEEARLEQERRELEQQGQEELERKREIIQTLRMEQIINALEFEVLTADTENKTASYDSSEAGGSDLQDIQVYDADADGNTLSGQILSSERKGSKPECVICLQPYKAGQVLCSANTSNCHHIFHEECAIGWLQESNECPLCRVDLLAAAEVSV